MRAVRQICAAAAGLLLLALLAYGTAGYLARRTLLDADYLFAEIERAGPDLVLVETVREQLPPEMAFALTRPLERAVEEQADWLRGHVRTLADAVPPYLEDAERIHLRVDPAPLEKSLIQQVEQALATDPPEAYKRLTASEQRLAAGEIRRGISSAFDARRPFTLDSDALPVEASAVVSRLRQNIRFLQLYGLGTVAIAAGGVAALLAVLSVGWLGTTLVAFGAGLALLVTLRDWLAGFVPIPFTEAISPSITGYIPIFASRMTRPLLPVGLACLAAGILVTGVALTLKARRHARRAVRHHHHRLPPPVRRR